VRCAQKTSLKKREKKWKERDWTARTGSGTLRLPSAGIGEGSGYTPGVQRTVKYPVDSAGVRRCKCVREW